MFSVPMARLPRTTAHSVLSSVLEVSCWSKYSNLQTQVFLEENSYGRENLSLKENNLNPAMYEDGNLKRKMKTERKSRITLPSQPFHTVYSYTTFTWCRKIPHCFFLKSYCHSTDIQDVAFRITGRSQILVKGNEFAV